MPSALVCSNPGALSNLLAVQQFRGSEICVLLCQTPPTSKRAEAVQAVQCNCQPTQASKSCMQYLKPRISKESPVAARGWLTGAAVTAPISKY
eukprot:1157794-Pelagomonas_calceolata.AAC.2